MSSLQLLFRRFASLAAVSSALAVASCGTDFGGLFEGEDASPDGGAHTDAPRDNGSAPDRVTDGRIDVTLDSVALEAATDGNADGARGDASVDTGSGSDANLDTDVGSDADADASFGMDARMDGDSRDATLDVSAERDVENEPVVDVVAEDATVDPRVDPPTEASVDVRVDAIADAVDGADAEPPGTCGLPCNTIDDIGATITRTVENGPPPMMTGGSIIDGTYVATAVVQYNGDMSAYAFSETSVISGHDDAWVSTVNGQTSRVMSTWTTMNGNQMTFDICCPSSSNVTILYTTSGNTLTHIDPINPNRVITYTRQ
jgi:hypothetical protein